MSDSGLAPTLPPTPPPSPPTAPGTPATGALTPRRRWALPALAIAVIAVVVVATLFATGVLSLTPSSTTPPQSYQIFSQAEATAEAGAGSVGGGPWYVVFGAALSVPTSILEPLTNISGLIGMGDCAPTWLAGEPTNLAVPATGPTAPTGAAAFWTFGLKNVTNVLLLESVSDGVAASLVTTSAGVCSELTEYLGSFPAGIVDSPTVVNAADQAGGSAFLAAHPNATQAWGAVAGISFDGLSSSPVWMVAYTSCSFPPSANENGLVFNATIGGTTGVVSASNTSTVSCLPTGITFAAHAGPALELAARKAI
ncbi:MAG: hypothetical protein WBF81_03600 [Thermoplasmata archaeon]